MGIMNNFLEKMNLGPDEDLLEDDDDILEDEDEEFDDDEPKSRFSFFGKKKAEEEDDDIPAPVERQERTVKTTPKVTAFRSPKGKGDMGVCIIKPTSVDDAREVAETLLRGKTVVLNMEGVNLDMAQRIIDFTSGACFAVNGNLQKISGFIFIITPASVEISGDVAELISAFDGGLHTDI